nr:RNA-directed DNA polymerase, eukaryota, reverse transcriptase zinc-binding domain protein [Tanacetum cinerariifolium]
KEDFDGSDIEKEGDNNVSMVPDSVKEDVNMQAEVKGNDFDVNNSLDPFELYPLLNKKKNVEEKMDKSNGTAKKDWIKEIYVSHKVNFLTLQETKMEDIYLIDVKCCWGNYAFEYVYSLAVGNSGGILCVWEKSAFKKNNSTIFDYFVMIGGSWLCSGVNLLIISVYAP